MLDKETAYGYLLHKRQFMDKCWIKRYLIEMCWIRKQFMDICYIRRQFMDKCWIRRQLIEICWMRRQFMDICWTRRQLMDICWIRRQGLNARNARNSSKPVLAQSVKKQWKLKILSMMFSGNVKMHRKVNTCLDQI